MKKFTFLLIALISIGIGLVKAQIVPYNWNIITSEITATEETVTVNEGLKAMSVTWTSTANQDIRSDAFTVTPGAAFTYTLDVYDNDAAGRVRMAIAWSSANSFSEVYSVDIAGWQTLTYTGTVPAEATTAQILLRFYDVGTGFTTATIIVDNASYSENGGANLLANPGFETWGEPILNPSLTVTAPTNGSTVNFDNVDVVFSVANFELGVDGQVEFVLNSGTATYSTTSPYNVTGLIEGSNTLNIQLVDLTNAALDPVVLVTRTFNYEIPSTDPEITITSPTEGGSVYSQDVNIAFTLANFELGVDGKIAYSLDEGEVVYYLGTSPIALTGLSYAAHTVDFELVDMTETSLDPAVTSTLNFTCVEALPGGMETFENSEIAAGVSYTDGSFIGDEGFTWNYYHCRDTGAFPINNRGIMLRRASVSYLESETISGGIASFQLEMRKAFTSTSERQLELYINGELKGTSQVFGTVEPDITVYTFSVTDINVPGDFTIKIKNVGSTDVNRQAVIDNISWTGYQGTDPYISITSPSNSAVVTTSDVDVVFSVVNFDLGTDGSVKYTVDGGSASYTTTSPIELLDLEDGEHTVLLELVDMGNASLDPSVTKQVTFTVNTAGPTITPIYDIQYTTAGDGASPLATQAVTTEGVVCGKFGDKFWIQDGAGAWNGIYVYYNTTGSPAMGDLVYVSATVTEYNGLTELSTITNITVQSSGNTIADPTVLNTGNVGVEMYEGVLVSTTGVCTNADAGYGMWEINDGSGVILIDDTMYPYTAVLGNSYTVTGLVDYSFDAWKILPRDAADVIDNGVSTDPMLIVSSPTNNATIYNDNTSVVFSVSNFVLGTDGKVAWNVDGDDDAYVTTSPITITGLTEGPHVINLELVDMSNASLSPAVTISINITVNLAGPEYTNIYDIQYTTNVNGNSPLVGQQVWIRAVVTANFNESEHFEGYFIQQGAGAWNGIYVYDLVNSPEIGDSVEIAASVDEFYNMTQLENVTSFEVIIPDGIVPTATLVSAADANTEQYEACLIKVHDAECTVAINQYGEWTVNDGTSDLKCQDNEMFDFTAVIGTHYDITGMTFYSYGAFELTYRRQSDIVVLANVDSEFASKISLYPNPASDFVSVNVPNGAEMITITNLVGQVVSEINVNSELSTINIENLEAGVYFAKITQADKTAVIKFIVE
ncbi:MAG TPA: T9SS type A sorting domain-containing protein [Bacteroidales bacterium]|nr:T9SS type A sorting domain-containing protein [Bacteroidales bacterium]